MDTASPRGIGNWAGELIRPGDTHVMTCDACCREFRADRHDKDCPYCGYNNGKGWWPRSDAAGAAAKAEEKRLARELRRKKHSAARLTGAFAHV